MMTLFGIRNCNTVKAAVTWLNKNKVDFAFHDYKSKGITEDKLLAWIKQVGWESLLNKRGTTWRKLDPRVQEKISSPESAMKLMINNTSLIKRPLIESDGKVKTLGFDETEFKKAYA